MASTATKTKDKVLCAAIWYDDGVVRPHQPRNVKSGIVVAGHRHCSCFVILASIFPNREYVGHEGTKKLRQGFLTEQNYFVNREDAGFVAWNAYQTEERKKELFSEDLY